MATLTLGKSVTTDAVQSKKGDAVFVERRRRVIAPGSHELRDEPKNPSVAKNAADEKLRAVLEAAKARDEERRKREAVEASARAAREAEIVRDAEEYEAVKEKLSAKESVEEENKRQNPEARNHIDKTFSAPIKTARESDDDNRKNGSSRKNKDFSKGKISIHDIVIG